MRLCRSAALLPLVLLASGMAPTARGQGDDETPARGKEGGGLAINRTLDPDPDAPSPRITKPPLEGDYLVVPLRVHVLRAPGVPDVQCGLTDRDVRRVVGKVNAVWHRAGIHWALAPIVREPAARVDQFQAARRGNPANPQAIYKLLMPLDSRSDVGVDLYYVHEFPINGVCFADRTAIVKETARVRPIPGGIDEALARVTAHELGHALGLRHRADPDNLLSSRTSGVALNQREADIVRERAPQLPGTRPLADLRHDLDEARARSDMAEVDRLRALLPDQKAPANSTPGRPKK